MNGIVLCVCGQALHDEDFTLWIDVDLVSFPPDIIQTLLATQQCADSVVLFAERHDDPDALVTQLYLTGAGTLWFPTVWCRLGRDRTI